MNKRERIVIGIVLLGCAALIGLLAEAIALAVALVIGYLVGHHALLDRFGLTGTGEAMEDRDPFDIFLGLLVIAVIISALVHAVAVAAMIAGIAVLIWGFPYWLLRDESRPFRGQRHEGEADRPRLERGDS